MTKQESILELIARLDKHHREMDGDIFGAHMKQDWPRIKEALVAYRAYVEEDVRLERGTACIDLLARINAGKPTRYQLEDAGLITMEEPLK